MCNANVHQFPASTLREIARELVAIHRTAQLRQLTWRERARYAQLMRQRNRLAS